LVQSKLEWAELKMANEEEKAFRTPQKKEPINENSEIEVDRSSGSMHESSSIGGGLHIISSEAKIIQKVEIVEKVIEP
jgi:hypothetical protein